MNINDKRFHPHLSLLFGATALAMVACGGSGDDPAPAPAPEPAPVPGIQTLSGTVVRSGPLKNVLVCLDLNANDVCGEGEPASARTGADGAYSLTYDPATIPGAEKASLIAPVVPGDVSDPTTTIDMAYPDVASTTLPYVMTRVPGAGGPINPLTTLVAVGVADGMTEAVARANVAVQLGIAESKIDNYQDDPPHRDSNVLDTARYAALFTSAAQRSGARLAVGDQSAGVPAEMGPLTMLTYGDAANYRVRYAERLAKPAGPGPLLATDVIAAKSDGASIDKAQLYNFAYLSPAGWVVCDDTVPSASTSGMPYRLTFCNSEHSLVYHGAITDIGGQSMADVVTQFQGRVGNSINNGVATAGLLGALGNASFPAGSQSLTRIAVKVNSAIYISNLYNDGRPQAEATTLDQLVAAKPASGVNLASGGGTISLGITSSALKNLRVAFTGASSATAGTVQFYECDLNSAQTVVSNCTTLSTGTYEISTVNGVRVMRFAGHPATVMDHTRVYAEVKWGGANGDWVYQAREPKSAIALGRSSRSERLNANAWSAMKAQLGL